MRLTTKPPGFAPPFPALQSGQATQDSACPTQLDLRVQQVMQLLQENIAKPYYLKELAAAVNLSPRQLERLFQREIQFTPLQYLKRLRLAQAANLLCTTDRDIKEIRLEVGYNDARQFGADFKRHFGCPPRQYRLLKQG
jgi:transcriptional regulator GlxA family with amidase domain